MDSDPLTLDLHGSRPFCRVARNIRERGEDTFDIASRGDKAVVSNDRPRSDHHLWSDEATVPDLGCPGEKGGSVTAQGPFDRVVRINMRPGSDIDIIADRQGAVSAIEERVRADTALLPHGDNTQDQTLIVDRRAFPEPIIASQFPPIVKQCPEGDVAVVLRFHPLP